MATPTIVPLSEFRQHSSAMVKEVSESSTPLLLTQNGKAAAVVVSPDMWENMNKSLTMMRLLTTLDNQPAETDIPFDEVMDDIGNMVDSHGQ